MIAMSQADQMLLTTHLVQTFNGETPVGLGTAFFFTFNMRDGGRLTLLGTNKHVISGADRVQVNFHVRTLGSNKLESMPVTLSPIQAIEHPDLDVDLCLFPIGDPGAIALRQGKEVVVMSLVEENIPREADWDNFDAIEQVIMVGCPRGIYDAVNNMPIVRSGITASNPRLRYNGKEEFMVDMACFNGSSGSPVFLAPSLSAMDRTTGKINFGQPRKALFLGILYAGPVFTAQGEVVLSSRPHVEVGTMMHLGYVIRSNRILDMKPIISAQLESLGMAALA